MKRECLHPHEIPVEVVTKLPGMHWGEVLLIGFLVSGIATMLVMMLFLSHGTAYRAGQDAGKDVDPVPVTLDLDPDPPVFRDLTIYDGNSVVFFHPNDTTTIHGDLVVTGKIINKY